MSQEISSLVTVESVQQKLRAYRISGMAQALSGRLIQARASDCDYLEFLDGLLDDKQPIPQPTGLAALRRRREYRGWTWALVDIDLSELGDKATRVNITLPQRILRAVDAHAHRRGETRSGFLARAAIDAMHRSMPG